VSMHVISVIFSNFLVISFSSGPLLVATLLALARLDIG
jgi:hypothetical protein